MRKSYGLDRAGRPNPDFYRRSSRYYSALVENTSETTLEFLSESTYSIYDSQKGARREIKFTPLKISQAQHSFADHSAGAAGMIPNTDLVWFCPSGRFVLTIHDNMIVLLERK